MSSETTASAGVFNNVIHWFGMLGLGILLGMTLGRCGSDIDCQMDAPVQAAHMHAAGPRLSLCVWREGDGWHEMPR